MHFDNSFFEGEERNGFYIRPMIKRAWAVELDVLEVISRICRKFQIRWFAGSGTLLGAVRDSGFIAWDDDLDIAMLRPDYEKFMKYARKELPKGWRLINGRQDKDPDEAILRVVNNTSSVNVSPEFLKKNHGCPYMIGVDIFVLDNIPDDPVEEQDYRALSAAAYNSFKEAGRGLLLDECSEEVRTETADLEKYCSVQFDREKPIKPQLLDLADHLSAMYYDSNTEYVSIAPIYCVSPKFKFPRSAFDKIDRKPFETTSLPVPAGYDAVLRASYGPNYMVPRQRKSMHEYPYFAPSERELRRLYEEKGLDFPKEFE